MENGRDDFNMQILATESAGFSVLMLLHRNIHPVTVAFVGSIRHQTHPDLIHV
jgi:hypothetical protein